MSAKRVNVRRGRRARYMETSGLVVTVISPAEFALERAGWARPQDLEPVKGTMGDRSLYGATQDGDGRGSS